MVVKEIAKKVIDALPESASMEDVMHALYVHEKFERGLRQIRAGKGIPHEEVKKRLKKWVK